MTNSSVARVASVTVLLLAMSAVVSPGASGQGPLQDVVYLENGSVIRGTIIEQIPGESLRIQTRDGSIFVYRLDEVVRITRETVLEAPVRKDPGTALLLALGPGLIGLQGGGQLYNNEARKGVFFLVAGLVGGALVIGDSGPGERESGANTRAGIGALIVVGSLTWSSIDAYRSAQRINREQGLIGAHNGTRLRLGLDPRPGGRFEIGLTRSLAF